MVVTVMAESQQKLYGFAYVVLWVATIAGLYALSQHNYLLFHTSVELFSVVVAAGMFMVAWNTRDYLDNGYVSLLGIAYLFVAAIDLVHTFAYKGMGLIPGDEANLATQLWIAARYVESLTLLVAPAFLHRKLRHRPALAAYGGILALAILTILVWKVFPTCYVEGIGLTAFKKASEYAISAILVVAILLLLRRRKDFDRRVMGWLVASLGLTVGSELLFTFYVSVYGLSNLFGHILKGASFYLIYRALIETGLRRPFVLIFRQLKESERALQNTNEALELRVAERTKELSETNAMLREEAHVRLATEKQLQRQNFVLKAIRNVNQLIVREHDTHDLLDETCAALVERSGYSTAWITLRDEKQRLLASSHRSIEGRFPRLSGLFSDDGIPPCVSRAWEGRGIAVLSPDGDPCAGCPSRGCCDQTRMTACLEHEGVRYGVLGVTSPEGLATSEEELDLLQEVAEDIAFALHDIYLEEEKELAVDALHGALQGTIQAVAATAESRDPYTAGHQRRVTQLSLAIGRELGLDDDRLEALHVAALLHDIGKVAVPAEILSKPSRLTDAETALIQAHPRRAYDILKYIEFPWPIAEFVLQHHERLEGSGYPDGLVGDEIHLEARILAVADVVEAMSSHRPYRAALGIDAALAEIEQNAGRLYDERAATACLRLFRERGFVFEAEA